MRLEDWVQADLGWTIARANLKHGSAAAAYHLGLRAKGAETPSNREGNPGLRVAADWPMAHAANSSGH